MARKPEYTVLSLRVIDVAPLKGRRTIRQDSVEKLAASIQEIGLQTPITVRPDPESGDYFLVAGAHRLAAVQHLGQERINCVVAEWDEDEARLWEIAENLHRADLSKLERSEQVAEWIRLTEKRAEGVSAQVAPKPKGGRPRGGVNEAVRELGVERTEAQRAVKIANGITPEAKAAAQEAGLDDNQSALVRIASAPKERQIEIVHEIIANPTSNDAEAKERKRLMDAWVKARPSVRQWFLDFAHNGQEQAAS